MLRCICATRALEIFIQDFTGVNLRHRYACGLVRQCRTLTGRSSAHTPHSVPVGHADDPIISYDTVNFTGHSSVSDLSLRHQDVGKSDAHHTDPSTQPLHVAVEGLGRTNISSPASSNDKKASFGYAVRGSQGTESSSSGELVDKVTLPNLASLQHPILNDAVPSAILGPVDPTNSATKKGKPRARLARRQRREAIGIYRLAASERKERETEVARVETVLDKIESFDGPSVAREARMKPLDKFKKNKGIEKRGEQDDTLNKSQDLKRDRKPLSKKKERWQIQKSALEHKFGDSGWQPRKRLSPDTLEGIRALHASDPVLYSTDALAENFKVSPESIRRILKAKWKPNEAEMEDRRLRWERRGVKKWQALADSGIRPPAKWRAMGVGTADGVKEDRVPKRKKPKPVSNLSWDDVVADIDPDNFGASISQRLL